MIIVLITRTMSVANTMLIQIILLEEFEVGVDDEVTIRQKALLMLIA